MRLVRSLAFALILLAPAAARAQTPPTQAGPSFPVPVPATGSVFDGLNLLLTRQRLAQIEAAVQNGDPIAVQACTAAIASANGYLGQTPNPIQGVFQVPSYYSSAQAIQQQITAQIRGDGRAALALAWAYALTGWPTYAAQSKAFIYAWVDNLTYPVDGQGDSGFTAIEDVILGETGGDTALVTHYSFPLFLYAYDILNGLGQISAAEQNQIQVWLGPFIQYHLAQESFPNNHLDWQVLFLSVAAHVTANQQLMDTAVSYYLSGMSEQQIAADGSLWRELARGEKAATYTLMALEAMVQFCVIAENHGVPGLQNVVAGAQNPTGLAALELDYVTGFRSSGVSTQGGTLQEGIATLIDFVNDPASWNQWQNVIQSATIDGPTEPSDWGWILEIPYSWWQDPSYLPLMQEAPYDLQPIRAYTLHYATLLFRAFPGGSSVTAPAPASAGSSGTGTASSSGGASVGSVTSGTGLFPVGSVTAPGSTAGGANATSGLGGGGGGHGGCAVAPASGAPSSQIPIIMMLGLTLLARRRGARGSFAPGGERS